ncbi:MAG: molecular chaperone HtpG [Clostridia bacterium]|nr:molecular chaperone HtpG [Clostridia bacterium]
MNEQMKKGGISVETEHIFPIIKKWLYSEKEIFLREIVSNACDACTKLKRLSSLGQADFSGENFRIDVKLDKDAKTLTVSDNGIGMTEDELEKYICSIALSGALDFISKYEGETEGNSSGIIGHFGLGFYSAFMVSDKVDVITKSYTDAPSLKWTCTDDGEYEIDATYERDGRGTDVVMHITDEEAEYLGAFKIRDILDKYCSFMPIDIYFDDGEEHKDDKKEEPKPINDTTPLWQKAPSECTDDDYKAFYRKVFNDYKEPLFWIHLNADYPLNFKGILYFPKISHEYESLEGQVKLYYNQVFVADNIKEIIPEYMLMLRGVLDCPELPLNVSRSYLQNNAYVSKVQTHITKKVADKLTGMLSNDRPSYEKIWGDIRMFIEYACLRDTKFRDRMKDSMLFETTDGKHVTMQEYLDDAKEKHADTFYYTTDKVAQAQYVSMYNKQGIDVVILDTVIDSQYITQLEGDNKDLKFLRVDADIASAMKADGDVKENEKITALFKKVSGKDDLTVKFEALLDEGTPAILNTSEEDRRFTDMMKVYGMGDMPSNEKLTIVVNTKNPLISSLGDKLDADENSTDAETLAKRIWMLSLLSYRRLSAEELQEFLGEFYSALGQ